MHIQEGAGWRLQLDPQRQPYPALIGGQDWAVELNHTELLCLRRGVIRLIEQYNQILPCLMPEEKITLELDLPVDASTGAGAAADPSAKAAQGQLFIALEGEADHWALRWVLTPAAGSRAVEGGWSAQASPPLAAALEHLPDGAPTAS